MAHSEFTTFGAGKAGYYIKGTLKDGNWFVCTCILEHKQFRFTDSEAEAKEVRDIFARTFPIVTYTVETL